MNGGKPEQTFMWLVLLGAGLIFIGYMNQPPQNWSYTPPYIPFGAETGSPCPPGWGSSWGGVPCGTPPGGFTQQFPGRFY